MSAAVHTREFSKIKEVVGLWSNIRQLLRARRARADWSRW